MGELEGAVSDEVGGQRSVGELGRRRIDDSFRVRLFATAIPSLYSCAMSDEQARAQAHDWLAQDCDPETKAELEALLADPGKAEQLRERFSGSLQFGTAGLRGVMGAGPMRMNRVLVQKVSAGLADYLASQNNSAGQQAVVVGYDGRHKSRIFAEDTASILLGKGFQVYLSTTCVPTPVVAFAVTDLKAAAGVMVTASHNPPEYNGYKVYWSNGAQIIPPNDTGIASAISQVGSVDQLERADLKSANDAGQLIDLDEALISRYYQGVQELSLHKDLLRQSALCVAYTPMHCRWPLCERCAGGCRLFQFSHGAEPSGARW